MAKVKNDKISIELDLKAQKAQEEIYRLTQQTKELRNQNTEHRKEISRLAATEGDHSQKINALNEKIAENQRQIVRNNRAVQEQRKNLDLSRMSAADLKKELKTLKSELANTSKSMYPERWKELEQQVKRCQEALREAEKPTKSLWQRFKELPGITDVAKGAFMAMGMTIVEYVTGSFKNLVTTITDFEKANSKLAAVLGTKIEGISTLTEQAKFLGRTTTATASDVTSLQTELAKLGFKSKDIENLTPAVLKFAKAVDTDLGSAAAYAGAAMRMFNKDTKDAEEVMATFAIATTNSALDFTKLENSLATVGPVANAFGFSVEDVTALLGKLSDAGFDASSAATATRNIFLNMADSSGDLAQALGRPIANLDDMVAGLKKLKGEGIDLAKALELTDKRSVAAFSTFLNQADSLLALRDTITDCTGAFQDMSATMADNAAASWMGFESAVEGLILKFFDFRHGLKLIYEAAINVVNWIGTLIDLFAPFGSMIKDVAKGVAYVVGGLATFVGWLTKLASQSKVVKSLLAALVMGVTAYKTALMISNIKIKDFIASLMAKRAAMVAETGATWSATAALRAFTAALVANPLTAVAVAVTAIGAAVIAFTDDMDEAKETIDDTTKEMSYLESATKSYTDAVSGASVKVEQESAKLEALRKVAMDELETKENRIKAIKQLNAIIPNYNASLDAETGKYRENKAALDEYLKSMRKKLVIEASTEQYKALLDADSKKMAQVHKQWKAQRQVYEAAQKYLKDNPVKKEGDTLWDFYEMAIKTTGIANQSFVDFYKLLRTEESRAIEDFEKYIADLGVSMKDLKTAVDGENTPTKTPLDNINRAATTTIDRLAEINKRLKQLRKMKPEDDEEWKDIQKERKKLQDEKKELEGKAKKAKHEVGTYGKESLDEELDPIADEYQKKVVAINKENISQADKVIKKHQALVEYTAKANEALTELQNKSKASHKKTLNAIAEERTDMEKDLAKSQAEVNKVRAKQDADAHKERLTAVNTFYERYCDIVDQAVKDGTADQDAAELLKLNAQRSQYAEQLAELEKYQDAVMESEYLTEDEREKILDELEAKVKDVNRAILTNTGITSEKLHSLSKSSNTVVNMKEDYELKKRAIEQMYHVAQQLAGNDAEMAAKLEAEKLNRMAALNYEYQQNMWALKEQAGVTWGDVYQNELEKLKEQHRKGELLEKEYQKKVLDLKVSSTKKWIDLYSSQTSGMFQAIQDAEIGMSDAKYDTLIQQAKNNGEETAALEEEKENKKLEIQKKYADVNFAIKASQIIADTSVAIMKALADLGPIAGPVSAALIGTTGAAQLVQALAERNRVMNMQPSSTAAKAAKGSTGATASLTGFSEGGYTGDGDRYEVAGVVHRGEYVIPKPIMHNPAVVDAVSMIEAIRRNRAGAARPAAAEGRGFAEGGYTSGQGTPVSLQIAGSEDIKQAADELRRAIGNIKAHVVYQDIERADRTMDRARRPFTRK